MENQIKQLLFKIIYNKLNLQEIEEDFIKSNIPQKKINNPNNEEIISQYFFLRNDLYLDRLSLEEKTFIVSKMNSINENDKKELNEFLENNLLKLLLPETDKTYIYWDGSDDEHLAPSDAIVIAFHTIEFLNGIDESRNMYINKKLNYIQDVLGPQNNLKVAIIKYNEVPTEITEI